jgi:hypothetical protein
MLFRVVSCNSPSKQVGRLFNTYGSLSRKNQTPNQYNVKFSSHITLKRRYFFQHNPEANRFIRIIF